MQKPAQLDSNDEEWEEEASEDIHFEIMNYPADTTLKGYKEQWDNQQLQIPEFQRNYVWDQSRASRLIESFLLGLSVPGVFLYKKKESDHYLVIDGQQRITTIVNFLKGTFKDKKFKLKKVGSKWEGKAFEDLKKEDQFKLETAIMRSTIIQQLNPEDNSSIYHIFERLNTGGMKLHPMEVRMCISEGSFTSMLTKLNSNEKWRKLFGKTDEDKRSRDKELILRILALHDKEQEYRAPMKKFLNDYIDNNKKIGNGQIKDKENIFLKAVDKAISIKEKPFHLHSRGLNFSVMDSIMVALMQTSVEDKDKIKKAYDNLIKNEEYINLIEQGQVSKPEVVKRLTIAKEAFA